MGYFMNQLETRFRIKEENKDKALTSLRQAFSTSTTLRESWAWTEGELKDAESLEKAMLALDWDVDQDEHGDIIGTSFVGEKAGDEGIWFRALALYVEGGSYITMIGEDDEIWRWYFDGEKLQEQVATIVFPGDLWLVDGITGPHVVKAKDADAAVQTALGAGRWPNLDVCTLREKGQVWVVPVSIIGGN